MGDSIPDTAEHAADLLFRVNRTIRRAAFADQPANAPTPAQARALRALGRSGAGMRMSELADELGIVRRSATSVVEALVEAGLATRHTDPDDGRAVVVALTHAGRAQLEAAAHRRSAAGTEVLGRLSGREVARLVSLLERLL